jgi:hypothetical protein
VLAISDLTFSSCGEFIESTQSEAAEDKLSDQQLQEHTRKMIQKVGRRKKMEAS